jgi:chromosome segregation ATPase
VNADRAQKLASLVTEILLFLDAEQIERTSASVQSEKSIPYTESVCKAVEERTRFITEQRDCFLQQNEGLRREIRNLTAERDDLRRQVAGLTEKNANLRASAQRAPACLDDILQWELRAKTMKTERDAARRECERMKAERDSAHDFLYQFGRSIARLRDLCKLASAIGSQNPAADLAGCLPVVQEKLAALEDVRRTVESCHGETRYEPTTELGRDVFFLRLPEWYRAHLDSGIKGE